MIPASAPPTPVELSVIVPVYNEAASLPVLYERLKAVLDALALSWELILVDDGSRDESFAIIERLGEADARVKGVRFARNFGKESAMAAGLHRVAGRAAVIMDADLQHPPELIPQMLERWRTGAAIVTAVRTDRDTDSPLRRWLSLAFYRFYRGISEIALTPGGGDFASSIGAWWQP